MQRHDLKAVVDGQRHCGRYDAASRQSLINPVTNLTPGCRAADDPADGQLARQLRLGAVSLRVIEHQPREPPRLSVLTRHRANKPRVRRGPNLRAGRKGCLPWPQPTRVLAPYAFPDSAIPVAKWGEDDGAVPQRDRPMVAAEAAQAGEPVRPLLQARHLSDRHRVTG